MLKRTKTQKIFEELCSVLPGGVNSPVRAFSGMGQLPMVADHAAKDLIYDVEGNAYIDYCGSWGALIHGHAHPEILNAVYKRMQMGTSFGVTTSIEAQLAQKVIQCIPSVEKIRFVSSGTEATMSAVRLARGFSGRQYVVKFSGNYHGHADLFLVRAGSGVMGLVESSSAGIPKENIKYTISLPYNDIEACLKIFQQEKLRNEIAAVIVEPIAGNMGLVPGSLAFLQMLREETQKHGIILIFDEVMTGFRVALGGAQALYQITPDISCFGKIIGGGFPAAAFGGRREIMDKLAPLGPIYQAGTLSGNPVAMEAGLQSLNLLQAEGFSYQELERKTNVIADPVRAALKDKAACLQQVGSMFSLFFGRREVRNGEEVRQVDSEMYARLFRFLFDRGVYIPPSACEAWFVSNAHEEAHLEKTRDLILEFINASI